MVQILAVAALDDRERASDSGMDFDTHDFSQSRREPVTRLVRVEPRVEYTLGWRIEVVSHANRGVWLSAHNGVSHVTSLRAPAPGARGGLPFGHLVLLAAERDRFQRAELGAAPEPDRVIPQVSHRLRTAWLRTILRGLRGLSASSVRFWGKDLD